MAHFTLQRARELETRSGKISYLIHEPPGFADDRRPGLLFLHGSGERGSDLRLLTNTAIPELIERGKNLPFVTISPQCPHGLEWSDLIQGLQDLLDHVVPSAAINPERLYLTGISMGGYGAWQLASVIPERFAALAPICGGGNILWADQLKGLPTWAFHGARDTVVEVSESRRMVDALEHLGAPIKLTVYDDLGHDCWTRAYADPELYSWMLGIKRSADTGSTDPRVGYPPPYAPMAR